MAIVAVFGGGSLPLNDQDDLFRRAGHSTSSSMDRCFPESLQLPPLGSTALQALRNDLTSKVAEALSRRAPTDKRTTGPFADLKLTTNSAVTYTSSGSARTDLFFQYKGTDPLSGPSNEQINHLLQQVNLFAAHFLPNSIYRVLKYVPSYMLRAVLLTSGMAGRCSGHPEAHSAPERCQRWERRAEAIP